MRVQVQKWGNSLALRIPKALAQEAEVRQGTDIELTATRGKLVAVPVSKRPFTLAQLLAGITEENIHGEVNFGQAAGREAW